MSQTEQVLAYMKRHGSITTWQAISELKCTRLPARIGNLKDRHIRISDRWIQKNGKRFKEYRRG